MQHRSSRQLFAWQRGAFNADAREICLYILIPPHAHYSASLFLIQFELMGHESWGIRIPLPFKHIIIIIITIRSPDDFDERLHQGLVELILVVAFYSIKEPLVSLSLQLLTTPYELCSRPIQNSGFIAFTIGGPP